MVFFFACFSYLYPAAVGGPLWCWANFATVLWFVAVPWIAERIPKDLEGPNSKWKWLFHGTQQCKARNDRGAAEEKDVPGHSTVTTASGRHVDEVMMAQTDSPNV